MYYQRPAEKRREGETPLGKNKLGRDEKRNPEELAPRSRLSKTSAFSFN